MARGAYVETLEVIAATDDSRPPVLIVDDVEPNLRLLEGLLADMRCEVVRATSGEEALQELAQREFALMLLDVHMPCMDGYEVAALVREQPSARNMPILFVTATHDDHANVLRGYGSGAVDFLFKPIDGFVLRSKVRVFLDLHASRRALERAYRELQHVQAQLVQSAKMSSLGELVAGIAHEINNPLAFAQSHLATARDQLSRIEPETRGSLTPPARERWERASNRLSEMNVGLDRIADLVRKLRTFSRLDEGERKAVSVRECLDSVLTIFAHRYRERIEVDVQLEEPDRLDCYPALFNQALANLLSNAIDAIADRGRITIRAGQRGGDFALTVEDTGPGIPQGLRARVLDPFFTTKPVGQGTGLGLSITYSIVKKHGGELALSDAAGGGARVTIRIPLDASAGERHDG